MVTPNFAFSFQQKITILEPDIELDFQCRSKDKTILNAIEQKFKSLCTFILINTENWSKFSIFCEIQDRLLQIVKIKKTFGFSCCLRLNKDMIKNMGTNVLEMLKAYLVFHKKY